MQLTSILKEPIFFSSTKIKNDSKYITHSRFYDMKVVICTIIKPISLGLSYNH